MNLHVLQQVAAPIEAPPTQRTRVHPVARVCDRVLLERGLVCESLPAGGTGVRSLPGVAAAVHHQAAAVLEELAAGLAGERRLVGVRAQVDPQVGLEGEGFLTGGAAERFLPGVDAVMRTQLRRFVERFAANVTLLSPAGSLSPAVVLIRLPGRFEAFGPVVALGWWKAVPARFRFGSGSFVSQSRSERVGLLLQNRLLFFRADAQLLVFLFDL